MPPVVSAAHELGTEKIGKLLFQYSLPAIIAMTASSLYNIIDRILIGQGVGALAISGLALTLPLMNLAIAFGALVGAGAATLVSIRLGEQRNEEAARILGTTVLLNLILSTGYAGIMFVLLEEILRWFGASSATLPYAKEFMQIVLVGNVFLHSYMGLNNILRASGYPRKAMLITLSTVGVNLVLATPFILVFHWGIRGAAWATVIAQVVGLVVTVLHFSSSRSGVRFLRGNFTLDPRIIRDIFSIGMSPFILHTGACLFTIVMNRQLVTYGGDYAVGAFGIINSLLICVVMIVIGLTQGMQPIAGYNYGARQFGRMISVFQRTIIVATCITTFGFLLAEVFPRQIALAFTTESELVGLSTTGMRWVLCMFPIVGFQMVTSNFFQSIGRARISVCLSLSRQLFFLIPALLILPRLFGLVGVWAAIPAADLSASIVTFLVLRREASRWACARRGDAMALYSVEGA
jgi:putative MATE family efflux protein